MYLYVINYAKSNPDNAILAVNTFVRVRAPAAAAAAARALTRGGFSQDTADPNPLIRALAVRTMGCIRVQTITEYLFDPLRRCLEDSDPYVRKTACVCVAKMFDLAPTLVQDQGFVDILRSRISDSNPTVRGAAARARPSRHALTPRAARPARRWWPTPWLRSRRSRT